MLNAPFDSELKTERNTSRVLVPKNVAKHVPGASGSTTFRDIFKPTKLNNHQQISFVSSIMLRRCYVAHGVRFRA